ncbi:MAG TPA: sporulation integral membrane protein YtvI [Bacillaceae bacterium]
MAGFFKRIHLVAILLILVAALILYYILPVSVPLISALITALLLEPLVKLVMEKLKCKRHLSVLAVFTLFALVLGASIFFISTKVVTQGIKLIEESPSYLNNVTEMWSGLEKRFTSAAQDLPKEMVKAITDEANTFLETFGKSLKQHINIENISAILSYIPNYLVSFLVYLIALFLFMIELPKLKRMIFQYFTEKTSAKVRFMASRISSVVFGFFKAQFLVSLIILAASFIGLLLIAPKVAIIMAIVIWIVDLIPIIGSIVILAPWSIYHLLTGNIGLGTKLAILAVILLIIRRTVEPKVMGTHMGLSPLATLIAMYLGLKLLGVLGLIAGPILLILVKSAKEAGLIKMNFKI